MDGRYSISVFRTSEGNYKARLTYTLPGQAQDRLYRSHRTKAGAEARAKEAWDEISRGLKTEKALTLGAYLDRWLDGRAAVRTRPSTQNSYRVACRRIKQAAGGVILRDLTPRTAQEVIAALVAHPYAPSTIQTTRRIFSAALHDAVRDRLLATNPVPESAAPRVPRKKRRRLSAPEAMQVLRGAEEAGDEFWALWVVLLNTGLRIGEALGLRWQDVNLDERQLAVSGQISRTRGKNPRFQWGPRKRRDEADVLVLPLTAAAAHALRERRAEQDGQRQRAGAEWEDEFGGLVFTTAWGRPLYAAHIHRRLQRALVQAGLPEGLRVHDTRHSVASLLLGQEVPLAVISALLGHSGISVTASTYARADLDVLRTALRRLEAAMGTEGER